MLLWTNAPTFTSSTAVWARVYAAIFCYPITLAHTLVPHTFASIRAITWTGKKKEINNIFYDVITFSYEYALIPYQLLMKYSAWKPFNT